MVYSDAFWEYSYFGGGGFNIRGLRGLWFDYRGTLLQNVQLLIRRPQNKKHKRILLGYLVVRSRMKGLYPTGLKMKGAYPAGLLDSKGCSLQDLGFQVCIPLGLRLEVGSLQGSEL